MHQVSQISVNLSLHTSSLRLLVLFIKHRLPPSFLWLSLRIPVRLLLSSTEDSFHDLLAPKVNSLQWSNAIVRAPTAMTPVTASTHTIPVTIAVVVIAYSTAFDAGFRATSLRVVVANEIATCASRAGLSFGLGRLQLVGSGRGHGGCSYVATVCNGRVV